MSQASIRQPLVVYASVLALTISFAVLTLSGLALSRSSQRAYRRAVRQELQLLARAGLLPGRPEPDAEVALGLVSTGTQAFGLSLSQARALADTPSLNERFVVLPLARHDEERYLVAEISEQIPTSIALSELSRLMPLVLLSTLFAAGIMAYLVYRQLLPSLHALAELADEPRTTPEGLARPDAPNEIVEIAMRFRETTFMLRSARERAEQQRDELENMQSSLIRASKLASVGRLAAGIAHEVGNPLAAIKGYLALMKDGLPEDQQEEALSRSIVELDRIHNIITKLLTYARPGTEQSTATEVFSLSEVVDEAYALARGHISLRDVEVIDELLRVGDRVEGQRSRLGQVLINLLLNAGQAMSEAPVKQIRLESRADEQGRAVVVSDTGPGVDPVHKDSIFDPFFTTKAPGEGTGLGLAVSKAMMEAMGGSLELGLSERGASFVLRLPLPRKEATQ